MSDTRTSDLATGGGLKPVAVGVPKLPKNGLKFISPFIARLIEGKKSVLVKAKPYAIDGVELLMVSRDKAHGIIRLSKPRQINLREFQSLTPKHGISPGTRKKFWPNRKKFWAYFVRSLKVFAEPIPIEPITGNKFMVRDVQLKTEESPVVFELTKAVTQDLADFGAWLRVLASKADRWSKSALRFVSGPADVADRIKSFPAKIREFAQAVSVSGGKAESPASFPVALENAIKVGKKALKGLPGHRGKTMPIREIVEELESIDKIVDAVQDAEDEPNIKLGKSEDE